MLGEDAVEAKRLDIIRGAQARITKLKQESWNYNYALKAARQRKGRYVIRRADGTIHAKSIDLSGAKKVGGQKWRGSNGK